ncbi:MAG: amidohydrolase [Lachnospiraceae bacterium]|nr:amidohydrolase [Lachnospiraceae bacterium]
MNTEIKDKIQTLWKQLHEQPELSGEENNTKAILKNFLKQNTSFRIEETDSCIYAVYDNTGERICLRADMDAICNSKGQAFHGCGHDGHSAALAGAALLLEEEHRKGETIDKSVIFLWQTAEETGAGARQSTNIIQKEDVQKIYGCHNIPGYPMGEVLLRKDVFACASKGMIISLQGKQSHAAYPEQGINPGYLLGDILCQLKKWCHLPDYRGMVLASIISIQEGNQNFGVSAGDAELSLTIRGEYLEDLEKLQQTIEEYTHTEALEQGVTVNFRYQDEFPDTVNDNELVEQFENKIAKKGYSYCYLSEPMRWSEDFGWYQKECPGVYFGVGSGEKTPGLHTDEYVYPIELLENMEEIWSTLFLK